MANTWFYVDGGERRGPVGVDELVSVLLQAPEPHRVLIWREGLPDWREAGEFPEIRQALPPPMVAAPPPFQASTPQRGPMLVAPMQAIPFDQAERIANLYRRLVLLIGVQLLLAFPFQMFAAAAGDAGSVLMLLLFPLLLGLAIAVVVTAYQLSQQMGESAPVLWAVAMFLPCLNIIALLILSSKAQSWCRQYGIRVGFLGPSKESIEELRQRGMTSHFE